MSGIGDKLYEGAAAYGKIESTFELIVGGIVCLVLCVIGIFLISYHYTSDNIKTTGTILGVTCNTHTSTHYYRGQPREQEVTTCEVSLEYVVNGKTYQQSVVKTDNQYSASDIGRKIDIWTDPNNPQVIYLENSMYMGIMGSISILFGSLILGGAGLNYHLTRKSKLYAAYQAFD